MPATILDGQRVAKRVRNQLAEQAADLPRPPGLAVLLVGDDPASHIYVRHKRRDCEEIGFRSWVQELPAETTQAQLIEKVEALNADPEVDGILVQSPLPGHLNEAALIERIDPTKDVDGYHPFNIGRLASRNPWFRPCTPKGVMRLLEETRVPFHGLDALVIGASNHVGRPMALELLLAGATVTVAHKFSRDLDALVRRSELVVSATGRAGLVRGEWIKDQAIVIDVGITRGEDGRLRGDIEFDVAAERASWITPVPGGVGPMTRAELLDNTLQAALARLNPRPGTRD